MAITDKTLQKELVERAGEHEIVRVQFEVWVIPGCEGAMAKAINNALKKCVFVSDWGGPTVLGRYPDGEDKVIVP